MENLETYLFWIGLIIAISEPIFRLIPDEKYKGLIGIIIDALKVASDYLNRGKR